MCLKKILLFNFVSCLEEGGAIEDVFLFECIYCHLISDDKLNLCS